MAHIDPGNLGAWTRYDGAPLFLEHSGRAKIRLGPMLPPYRTGYAFLTGFQERHYWRYRVPAEVRAMPMDARIADFLAKIPEETRADPSFQQGLAAAITVLDPTRSGP